MKETVQEPSQVAASTAASSSPRQSPSQQQQQPHLVTEVTTTSTAEKIPEEEKERKKEEKQQQHSHSIHPFPPHSPPRHPPVVVASNAPPVLPAAHHHHHNQFPHPQQQVRPAHHHHLLHPPMSPYTAAMPRSMPVSPVAGRRRMAPTSMLGFPGLPGTTVPGGGALLVHQNPQHHFHHPPEPDRVQKAMEQAVAAERARARRMEEDEADLSADELRVVLKRERVRTGRLAADLAASRSAAVQSQLEAEVLEEGRINQLMRRLDGLQQEKGRIIVELEREEEMLTNTLQKKLSEVRREKTVLEEQIEHQKKSNLQLTQQLSDLRGNRLAVAEALEEEDEMEEED